MQTSTIINKFNGIVQDLKIKNVSTVAGRKYETLRQRIMEDIGTVSQGTFDELEDENYHTLCEILYMTRSVA